jgi:hypothetical protein
MDANVNTATQTGVIAGAKLVIEQELTATAEQMAYAKLLDKGMKVGLLMVIATFAIYMVAAASGILSVYVPVKDLPFYWTMPVHDYLHHVNMPQGWSWLGMMNNVDILNFAGIAFLSGVTLICYARIVPIIWKQKDYVFTAIAILEILVLALAASGLLKTGGH